MSKFKIGDRVEWTDGIENDTGEIVAPYEHSSGEESWWIKWDSDGSTFHATEYQLTLITQVPKEEIPEQSSKTKSDGSSSDYYKLNINGNPAEVEDVIYAMVGGDFTLGNILKACRRMYLDSKGEGKEGVDMQYDANKIIYFANSYVKRFGGK